MEIGYCASISEFRFHEISGGWIYDVQGVSFDIKKIKHFGELFFKHHFQCTAEFLEELEKDDLCKRDFSDDIMRDRCDKLIFYIWNPRTRKKGETLASQAFIQGATEEVRTLLDGSTLYQKFYVPERKKRIPQGKIKEIQAIVRIKAEKFFRGVFETTPGNLDDAQKKSLGTLYRVCQAEISTMFKERVQQAEDRVKAAENVTSWHNLAVTLFLQDDEAFLSGVGFSKKT